MNARERLEEKLSKYMSAFEYAEAHRDMENAMKYIDIVLRIQDSLIEIQREAEIA